MACNCGTAQSLRELEMLFKPTPRSRAASEAFFACMAAAKLRRSASAPVKSPTQVAALALMPSLSNRPWSSFLMSTEEVSTGGGAGATGFWGGSGGLAGVVGHLSASSIFSDLLQWLKRESSAWQP